MTNRPPILIVDDDQTFRELVALFFEETCEVHTACCGHDAMEILKKKTIQVVFSDVQMPNGDGIELLDWITATNFPKKPVVVMITGQSILTEKTAAQKGAHTLLHKPFAMKTLLEIFEQIRS
jgi:DNA-binding NtrC family response regulator